MAGGGAKPGERRGGRQKGTPNKATKDARVFFAAFLDKKSARIQALWDRVAKNDPKGAIELLTKVGEFVIPKLARTEHSGPHGGAIPLASANANISDDEAMKSYQRLVKGEAP